MYLATSDDASVLTKDEHGKVRFSRQLKPTQHGAWTGAVVGAILGIIFPPGTLLGAAAGEVLHDGEAAKEAR